MSAVIPVYNGERYIEAAIESVLGQTFEAIECIVVDDGSTDHTADAIAGFDDARVRSLRQTNQGVSHARNRGIAEATGDLIAFLDADDVWLPHKIERQVEAFDQRPDLGLLVTGYTIVDDALRPLHTVIPDRRQLDLLRLLMLEASGIGLSFTGMARRSLAAQLGFDATYSTSADLEFALRARQITGFDALDEPLALYRTHLDQMHLDLDAFERDVLRIYDEWLVPGSALARHRRRADANLYTRLGFYEASRRRWGPSTRALGLALRARPDRVVALPLWAAAVRVRRRMARNRFVKGQPPWG